MEKKDAVRTTKGISISVPRELAPIIKEEAKRQGRTVSSFLSWLIRRDQEKTLLAKLTTVPSDTE